LASQQEKVVEKSPSQIIVDGTDHIAGRLCSNVAKLLLQGNRVSIVNCDQGNRVSIVNCDKIMISGKRKSIVEEYKAFLEIASILHPKHGPFHPRRPDTMISRMVRGMLPRKKPSGQAALKRLRAYIDVPKELKSTKKIQFENAKIKKSNSYFTSMGSLGETIGWTK
jgi:large subunit ribosomal protein L13